MKRILVSIAVALAIILGSIFVLRFVIGGSEDTWICVNGEWIKHGNPSTPQPTGECGW